MSWRNVMMDGLLERLNVLVFLEHFPEIMFRRLRKKQIL